MVTIDLDPTLFHLGPLAFSWYGLAVATGMLVGIWLLLREAQRRGLPTEPVLDLVLWIAVGGLVGTRRLYVLEPWAFFVVNRAQIVVRLLPYAAQPQEPPAGLKQRILARIARAGGLEDATIMHDRASIEGR